MDWVALLLRTLALRHVVSKRAMKQPQRRTDENLLAMLVSAHVSRSARSAPDAAGRQKKTVDR